jgi:alkylation response protein AidB-like acyl-CoA dehydrogenase
MTPEPPATDDHDFVAITSVADVIENARRLLPIVADEAAESERIGRMTDRMALAMRASGILEMAFPAHRGGIEAPLAIQTEVVEMIATVDAGIAWNVGVLAATGFYAGRLGDEAYAELYPTRDAPTAGCFWPRGRANVVDGGYLVTGRWATGSGMLSSPYVLGGAEVYRDGEQVRRPDGSPDVIGVWLRTDEVEIFDDWHVIGIRASGSNGYAVREAFIPTDHTFDRNYAAGTYLGPLERLPELPFVSLSGLPVGIAQHAVDLAAAHLVTMRERGRVPDARMLGLLGEAESLVRAARAVVLEGARRIDSIIFNEGTPTPFEAIRGDGPLATEFAQRVVRILSDIVGSQFVYERHPYEKLARDLFPVAVHGTGKPGMWVLAGQAILDHYATAETGAA